MTWFLQRAALAIALAAIVLSPPASGRYQQRDGTRRIAELLAAVARGEADVAPLTVTFRNRHALHGGLELTIRGDRTVEQKAERTDVGRPKQTVKRDDLQPLVALLVKQEVWSQRIEERLPRPDESIAALQTCYGKTCVEIWEWHNDLARNARIGDILKVMQQIAWKPAPTAWTLAMKTSGGFTGRGAGQVRATSGGSVMAGSGPFATCGSSLADEALRPLRQAVEAAEPDHWKPSYIDPQNPHSCCDMFRYSLTLELDYADSRATHATQWDDGTYGSLPADLQRLYTAAWNIKGQAKCDDAK